MIKGGFYGKLLKQFCFILLISCFILLGNYSDASVNGSTYSIGTHPSDFDGSYINSVSSQGFVKTRSMGYTKNVLMGYYGGYFFWNKDGLPYMAYNQTGLDDTFPWFGQGVVSTFLKCDKLTLGSIEPTNCVNYNFSTSSGMVSNFLKDGIDYYYMGTFKQSLDAFPDYLGFLACFSSDHNNASICFYSCGHWHCGSNNSDKIGGTYLTQNMSNSQGFTRSIESISNSYIGIYKGYGVGTSFTSSTGSRLIGRLVSEDSYTNRDMISAYECIGLQPQLCYGGFPINNIFEPSESYEDFTGYVSGQGATIFDLYNLYSGSFSSVDQFLNTVLTKYQNGQINSFKTEPKALLMVGSQLNVAGLKTSYVSTYCDLYLNHNNGLNYNGNSVDDLRAQSCLRSQRVSDSFRNFSGQEIIFQTTPDYFGSGGNINFDPETFFSNITETITSYLNGNIQGSVVGLIPGYIILFMLAIIFIRIISH